MAVEDFYNRWEGNRSSSTRRTDDVIYPNRSGVIGSFEYTFPRIMEPFRSYLEHLGFAFAEFTGETINQMVKTGRLRINLEGVKDGKFMYDACPRTEVAFSRNPELTLLSNTSLQPAYIQDRLVTEYFMETFGISGAIRVRRVSARDLIELGWRFKETTGSPLYNENSGIATTRADGKRVVVGTYAYPHNRFTLQVVSPFKGLKDVFGVFVLEPVSSGTGEAFEGKIGVAV